MRHHPFRSEGFPSRSKATIGNLKTFSTKLFAVLPGAVLKKMIIRSNERGELKNRELCDMGGGDWECKDITKPSRVCFKPHSSLSAETVWLFALDCRFRIRQIRVFVNGYGQMCTVCSRIVLDSTISVIQPQRQGVVINSTSGCSTLGNFAVEFELTRRIEAARVIAGAVVAYKSDIE